MITDHRTSFLTSCAALGLTTGVVAAMLTWAPPAVLPEAPARPAPQGTLSAPPWTPPVMTRQPVASSTSVQVLPQSSAAVTRTVQAYPNCAAARQAGAAPVHRGDLGWSPRLDGDGDGVGCDVAAPEADIDTNWPTSASTARPAAAPTTTPAVSPEPSTIAPQPPPPTATSTTLTPGPQ